MSTCADCKFWHRGGPAGSPMLRTETDETTGKLVQLSAYFCRSTPKNFWKYHDDWCGNWALNTPIKEVL